jgi:hypothetical protein
MRAHLLALVLSLTGGAATGQPADVVLVGGRVYTLDAARPWAEGLAIAGDRIAAVGATAEMRKLVGPRTRVVDLKGAFACPGFNDAHVHVDATGALLVGVNLLDVHSEPPFVERVRGAARLPKGSWIVRGDWSAYEQWGAGTAGAAPAAGATAGPFTPDRRMIDAASPDHPVFVNRFDRSMFLANSLALKLAGISESTPAPPGGEIVKDAGGRLTGILKGAAADLVRKVIPPIGVEQRRIEYLPPEERERLRREGYVSSSFGEPAPSVVALTVLASGMAACALLTLISDEGNVTPAGYLFDGFFGDAYETEPKQPRAGCRCRLSLGLGDTGAPPFLGS